MERVEVELFTDGSNNAVVRMPGRQFPGVVVQGDSKETLRLFGEPFAVTRVRTAMFNAALRWRDFELPES